MDSHIAVVLIDPLNEFLHPDGLHQISKEGTYFGWNHRNANHIGTRDHKVFDKAFSGQISKGFGLVFYIQILILLRAMLVNWAFMSRYYKLADNSIISTDAGAALSVELGEAATKVVWPVIEDQVMT
ncbi:hypothetical protein ETB97_011760, partial [Aspergillus alliaceus]